MITTKIIWTKGRDGAIQRQELLPVVAKTMAPDFESELLVLIDSDNNLASIRTWPSEEVAQAWIDYVVANFEVINATISHEPIDTSENTAILRSS